MDKILNKTNLIVNINQIMYNFTFLYLSKYFGHERNISAKPEIFRIFRLCRNYFVVVFFVYMQFYISVVVKIFWPWPKYFGPGQNFKQN